MMQLFDAMNVFRVLGDLSHVLTIFGLIYTIHKRKSSSSEISLKTQCLLALVFLVRYADTLIFWRWYSLYNLSMRALHITSVLYILYLLIFPFKRDGNSKFDTFPVALLLLVSLMMASTVSLYQTWRFHQFIWSFSVCLESVAILPQFLLIKKLGKVENPIVHWLVLVQSGYRIFYLFNWVERYFTQGYWDPISVYTGSIQAATTIIVLGVFFSVQGNPESSTPSPLILTIRSWYFSILRYIQLGTIVIVGYVFCYLVWMHNHHACKWYPNWCTDIEKANANVPWEYIVMITVLSTAFLENYLSMTQTKPNYLHMLCVTALIAVAISIAYFLVTSIPGITDMCYYNQIPPNARGKVEVRFCPMVVDARVCCAIALYSPLFHFKSY